MLEVVIVARAQSVIVTIKSSLIETVPTDPLTLSGYTPTFADKAVDTETTFPLEILKIELAAALDQSSNQ